tara:strand:- start:3456 stop:5288 length:1833 start_codon:yes stop_codon:yes gene_type:complete
MSTNKTNLSVNSLDFDTIKDSLKTYLKSQDEFKDFNFEGSGMSILLDILSYNTHMEAFYNNMIANEMFMDSAAKRSSIVSIAKHLGYTPSSPRSASASVDIKLGSTAGMDSNTIIPIYSKFVNSSGGRQYTFLNTASASVDINAADGIHVKDLAITEGRVGRITYVNDSQDDEQRFILTEPMTDTRTLTVRIQESATDTTGYTDSWSLADNINDVTSTSKVYFLQEVEDGKFEVYFGDGVIGKKLTDGNLVILEYLISSGSAANNLGVADAAGNRTFSYGGSGNEVIVKSFSSGGAERETSNSIRSNAPKSYQAQNRAVTIEDYKSLLAADYPDVESISVWGGEENDPPEYGAVIISFKPKQGTTITQATKDGIINSLVSNKGIVAIRAKIVDPNYINLLIKTTVNYDPVSISVEEQSLKTLVNNKITKFVDNDLEKFTKGLRHSKFVREIDNTDPAILGNETKVSMEYRLFPTTGQSRSYEINFGNALFHPYSGYESVISSTAFKYTDINGITRDAFFDDDGQGKLRIYYFNSGIKTYLSTDAGQVDYETGLLRLISLTFNSGADEAFVRIFSEPRLLDIDSTKNTILTIDKSDPNALEITMNPVRVTT